VNVTGLVRKPQRLSETVGATKHMTSHFSVHQQALRVQSSTLPCLMDPEVHKVHFIRSIGFKHRQLLRYFAL
jgi:hypothetical protein